MEGASHVAHIQDTILNAMEEVFPDGEYQSLEAAILAPGYTDWEGRAIRLIKNTVGDKFEAMNKEVAEINARYKQVVAHPGQEKEYWIDPITQPHLRTYDCLKCGFRTTSMALKGICCWGMPKCPRCKHEVHEPICRRKTKARSIQK